MLRLNIENARKIGIEKLLVTWMLKMQPAKKQYLQMVEALRK